MAAPDDIHAAIRAVIEAVVRGDPALIAASALPNRELHTLAHAKPVPAEVLADLDNIQTHVVGEQPERVIVHSYFRGVVTPISLQRTAGGWRADLRWIIAARKGPTPEVMACRGFMFAMVSGDAALMGQVALPHPGLEALTRSTPPAGEMAQLQHVCEEMFVIALEPGDSYLSLLGEKKTVGAADVGPGRAVMLAQFSGTELPMYLREVDGTWRVDAANFVESYRKMGI